MDHLSNEDKVQLLNLYQTCGLFHPLTCCNHVSMKPKEITSDIDSFVTMVCPVCYDVDDIAVNVAIDMVLICLRKEFNYWNKEITVENLNEEEKELFN